MRRILTREYRYIRIALFGMVFMLIPAIVDVSHHSIQTFKYETLPTTAFYESFGVGHEDVCEGQVNQLATTIRYVYRTETGWPMDVTKELFRHDESGQLVLQSYATNRANPFVEVAKNGTSTREVVIPPLREGRYHWELNITALYLPNNVVRQDVPPIIAEPFNVVKCNHDSLQTD